MQHLVLALEPHLALLLHASADLCDAAFAFRTAREIDIGFARLLCVRITYVGELGYELHVPAEQAVHAYERIVSAGEAFGLRHAGLKALSSLRMEKGYRDYGHDIDNTDTVLEAGLGFAVDLAKPGGFIGREAVLAERAKHTLGGAVGLAMLDSGGTSLDADWIAKGDWQVEIAGQRHSATVSLRPLYDPAMKRIRV